MLRPCEVKEVHANKRVIVVVQEVQALVDIAEFMHYWSRRGCTLELETEYHD